MTEAYDVWLRALHIGTGAPEVVARRLQRLAPPALWVSPAAWIEAQAMVLEKVTAAWESAFALQAAAFAWPALWSATGWWAPAQQQRLARHGLRTAERALAPVSRRVQANVRRLRRT